MTSSSATASRPLAARLRHDVAVKVKNVFDNNEMYFVVTQDRYTPDPGREVEFNLTTRF